MRFAIEHIRTPRAPTTLSRCATSVILLFLLAGCTQRDAALDGNGVDLQIVEEKLGGETTAYTVNRSAFKLSARNLSTENHRTFKVGDSFFNQNWITAPASAAGRDGLGPTFNAMACSACHPDDGRGKPPHDEYDPSRGFLIRLSISGPDGSDQPIDEPTYGGQLQDRAILGVPAEGSILIHRREWRQQFADSTYYTLVEPTYEITDLALGPLHPDVMMSPRVAPVMIGLGLLEAIPEADILAAADSDDHDGDGISGRPNMVPDLRTGQTVLGRFGWKAGQPTVEQQTASALRDDLGITNPLFPDENCPLPQRLCAAAPNGGEPELPQSRLNKIVLYTQTLAVPAMRDIDDPEVLQGARLFVDTGCASCHTPSYTTGEHVVDELSNQRIYPFTDLLLHDMGPDLADNRPEHEATGREWRTPPLWGIGLVYTVNRHTRFLHDGRARSLTEAILWHGGEAEPARERFRRMSVEERAALVRFLESL